MRDNAWVALAVVAVIIAFALSSSNGTGNAFTTMAVPNGTNPVASSPNDTLTFAEGSNITITGDAGSDTITIAATGAGSGDISAVGDCDTGDCFVLGGLGSELTFDPSNTVTYEEGRIYYDSDVNAFTAFNNEPDVALNIGEETWTFVRNNTGSTITNGQAVYVSGAIGNIPTIALAQADATATSNVIAVATHDIENNTTGYVTAFGAIRDLDTSSFIAGDTLFLSATVAGGLSTTRPTSPNFDVFVGTVTVAHPSVGIIYVDIRGRNSRIDCNGPNDALTFTLATDVFGCNTITGGSGSIDVELNGTTAVTGAAVMDFLSPFDVVNDAGDAQISLDTTQLPVATWGDGSTFAWTLTSNGDATLNLTADADNTSTADNPFFNLRQGGGATHFQHTINSVGDYMIQAVTGGRHLELDTTATGFDINLDSGGDISLLPGVTGDVAIGSGSGDIFLSAANTASDVINLIWGSSQYSFDRDNADWLGNALRNFGFIESNAATPSTAGAIRLGNTEQIAWRNAGNTDNVTIGVTGSDVFEFDNGGLQFNALPNCNLLDTDGNGLVGCDAATELYTVKKSINMLSPTTSETNKAQFEYGTAATITEVSCSTDTGTVTIQLDERARATPNTAGTNIMTSALVCDTDSQTTTSFTNPGIAADVPVNLQITATSGTPSVVRIHIKATKDD